MAASEPERFFFTICPEEKVLLSIAKQMLTFIDAIDTLSP